MFSTEPPQVWDVSGHVGFHFPRVRRGEIINGHFEPQRTLTVDACGLRAALESSVLAAKVLLEELHDICLVIEPDAAQLDAYGHRLRHLLITACTEVESAWRSVYVANCDCAPDRLTTNQYVRLADAMRLRGRTVVFNRTVPSRELRPLAGWDATRPTESLPWYAAYNATKHNREMRLDQATLGNVIDALAALHIMLNAQFGGEAEELLPARPFSMSTRAEWGVERYFMSPFDDGPWQVRKLFAP